MTTDELIGRQLDNYLPLSLLGRGGMARVYRAIDVRLKRYVALKVIDTPFRADSEYMRRFEREAQAIAQLEHPYIVTLYRYGQSEDLLYMAMQYVEGSDLQSVIAGYQQEGDFIQPAEATQIIRDICLALDYAHNKGVIHRDIKPSNILLDSQGRAFLADFGLVLLTDVGTRGEVFGTPHYIAPEQAISSAAAGPQSDLYAVGVILYEMCTGALPFDGEDSLEIAMRHMSEAPRPPRDLRPELSPQLEALILRALQKNPEERFASGAALANALEQAWLPANKTAVPPVTRKSVLQRVALDMAENPLPPLPAAVAAPTGHAEDVVTMPLPELPAKPGPSQPSPPALPFLLAGMGILIFAFLILCLAGLFILTRDQAGSEVIAAGPATATAEASMAADEENRSLSGETGAPEADESPEENEPQEEDHAPPEAIPDALQVWLPVVISSEVDTTMPALPVYTLWLVTDDKDLFLINRSGIAFPLESLEIRLENERRVLNQWHNMTFLQPDSCLVIGKERNQDSVRLPDGCHRQAGERLIFDWKEQLTLFFAGREAAACDVRQDVCAVTISLE